MKNRRVYLDNASTTPVDKDVLKVMSLYFSRIYGNPSSLHLEGRLAKKAVSEARKEISAVLGCETQEVIFTSGGTEANNLAILGIARANSFCHCEREQSPARLCHSGGNPDFKIDCHVAKPLPAGALPFSIMGYHEENQVARNDGKENICGCKRGHIITSKIEHKSVLDACKKLEKEGFDITYLPVNKSGVISIDEIKKNLRSDTILVSIMYANNEIGSIQPIKEIAKVVKASKICQPIFHTDACQAVGALTVNIKDLDVDALTFNASKVYGPKGIGCLYIKDGIKIEPTFVGGAQERGLRAGTENLAGIVGLGKAITLAEKKRARESKRLIVLRNYFLAKILKKIEGISVNGGTDERLPNNINISIKGVEGESLLLMLDNKGVACSTGSACSSVDLEPSYVLLAIGIPLELAHSSIRFTLGRHTTKNDLDFAIKALNESVDHIRKMTYEKRK